MTSASSRSRRRRRWRALTVLLPLALRRIKKGRLRALISCLGIAAGVALVSAVMLANARLTGGYERARAALAGGADVELLARSSQGMSQQVYRRVARVPGVRAAPESEHDVVLRANQHNLAVVLVGVDSRIRRLSGPLAKTLPTSKANEQAIGLYLPQSQADDLAVQTGDQLDVQFDGQQRPVLIAGVLSSSQLGSLAGMPIAVAPLGVAQTLTASTGQLSRILVALGPKQRPGDVDQLRRLAGPGVEVTSVSHETELLAQASAADRLTASLFSTVSLIVGALVAYNAIMLTVIERRRQMAIMRMLGGPSTTLLAALLCETLLIGLAGTVFGLAIGVWLLGGLVERSPTYLQAAFTLSSDSVVPAYVIIVAAAAGLFSTLAATLYPAYLLQRVPPAAALRAEALTPAGQRWKGVPRWLGPTAGVLAIVGASLALRVRDLGAEGVALFIFAGALALPVLIGPAIRLLRTRAKANSALQLALAELAAFPGRATATAGIGAVTVMVLVLVGGSVANLERGTERLSQNQFSEADLWISVNSPRNVFFTQPFRQHWLKAAERSSVVAKAVPYRSAFLDWGQRRILVFGTFAGPHERGGETDVVAGNPHGLHQRLLRARNMLITASLARDKDVGIGDQLTVPTPVGPRRFRITATISNYGWAPGAIAIGGNWFSRYWQQSDLTGIEIGLRPGITNGAGVRRLQAAFGSASGLRVETSALARTRIQNTTREGLAPLRRISNAVVIAAILAVVSAMLTTVAQRQRRLAALRAIGMSPAQTFAALIAEIAIVMLLGGLIGAVVGATAQALAVEVVKYLTSYPIVFRLEPSSISIAFATSAAVAVVAGALAAWRVSRAPLAASLHND